MWKEGEPPQIPPPNRSLHFDTLHEKKAPPDVTPIQHGVIREIIRENSEYTFLIGEGEWAEKVHFQRGTLSWALAQEVRKGWKNIGKNGSNRVPVCVCVSVFVRKEFI